MFFLHQSIAKRRTVYPLTGVDGVFFPPNFSIRCNILLHCRWECRDYARFIGRWGERIREGERKREGVREREKEREREREREKEREREREYLV